MAGGCETLFSYPMFRDLEKGQKVFTGIAAHRTLGVNLAFRRQTLNAEGMYVSGSYFPVLELRPAIGRLIGPSDDQTLGANPVVVLDYSYWQTKLASDPSVVGQSIVINGQPFTILRRPPRGFNRKPTRA